ncbi:MAG: phosphotransferase [bacterium]|nr:phosphotransferase [bacterium]
MLAFSSPLFFYRISSDALLALRRLGASGCARTSAQQMYRRTMHTDRVLACSLQEKHTMQGSLGEKIGEGISADVHAWAPGQVIKLFKAGTRQRICWYEARITRAVFAAGVPAPEVFGEITLEGRHGIVLSRHDGPTLLGHYRSGAVTFEQAGNILADLAMSVHRMPPPPEVINLQEYVEHSLRNHPGRLPEHLATGLLALIERLGPADGLCHVDIHPGNVIVSADGPKLIDWITAVRAPAAFDLARIHVGLAEVAPHLVDNPERPRAVNMAAQSEYARLAGMSSAELKAAIEPYLPIARAVVIFGDFPHLREWLIQRIEAALCTEG